MSNNYFLMIKHNQMEGERIKLRPVSLDDVDDMYEYTSDEETTRYIYDQHTDVNQTKKMIANYYMKEPIGMYAIVLKESNKMIGTFEFRIHEWNNSGELGFTLNSHFWGKGYMTEAGKLILELAFHTLGLDRVYAGHDVRNDASGKVLSRLGMTYEGTLRRDQMVKGALTDTAHYSLLKEEYLNSEKRKNNRVIN
ncbi:GNAT family N-acetyltransferase [Bacillus sp. MUM 13]|uniref:GNAT family N-acetyltransferase n=1 Tax=Bacillus sp. MUM 13 TaxID=1678001 RepID=UPI0008F59B13|nr:GNAT family N-acetyltransferase [Bacillus sp. MUM 13]OIK11794.1 GNAT family N-acetyltransferase [Bacillus sp. MUM 13]